MDSHKSFSKVLAKNLTSLRKHLRTRKFSPSDEIIFQDVYATRMYTQAKAGLIFGFFTWYIFSIWDFFFFRQQLLPIVIVRLLIFGGCIGYAAWVSIKHKERFIRHMQFYLSFGVSSAILGLFFVTLVAAQSYGEIAYTTAWPGFLIIYLFQYTFCRLLLRQALIIGAFSFFLILLLAFCVGTDEVIFFNSMFYLIAGNILGLVSCMRMETYERTVFLMKRRLNKQLYESHKQRDFAQQAHAQLIAVNAEKERFFSAAYHDLQQPLTTISLYVQIARKKLTNLAIFDVEQELAIMDNAKNEIALMFQEVRNIANIEHTETKIGAVDINAMLDEIEREFLEGAKLKKLSLRVKKRSREPLYIKSDRALLKRALTNLVGNAIKYTDAGGIVVGATNLKSHVRIDVWDTGKGIPDEFKIKIFDEYVQLDNPGRDRSRGLGLGLSIVKRIMSLLNNHDHRFSFSSKVGEGSRFSIDTPIAEGVFMSHETATDYKAPFEENSLAGKYVVIIEDEPHLLNGLIELVQTFGCFVEGADSVDLAIDIFNKAERSPNILLTDYRLKDGKTALNVIEAMQRSFEWESTIPVLIVTGELVIDETIKDKVEKYDICDKPIKADLLYQKMTGLITVD